MTTTLYLVLLGIGFIVALFHESQDGDGPSDGSGGGPRRLAKIPIRSDRPSSQR
jgi:hypothetical protein